MNVIQTGNEPGQAQGSAPSFDGNTHLAEEHRRDQDAPTIAIERMLFHLFGMIITWGVWLWLASNPLDTALYLAIAIGGTLAIVPLVITGRWLLDHPKILVRTPDARENHFPPHQSVVQRAEWVTIAVHYLVAIFLGSAVLAATRLGLASPTWIISLPPWVGLGLMTISGLMLLVVIFNLLLKGLGLPFAVALTRIVVTDWLYAWTRNPMILSALAFLVGLGLWLGSGLFLVWVLAVVSPALMVALKVYEERELEIRFGDAYLEYKRKTPMLWPRKPR